MTIYGRTAVSGRGVGFDPSFLPVAKATASVAGDLWLRGDSIASNAGAIVTWTDKFGNYPAATVTGGTPTFTASSSMYGGRAVSTWVASQYMTLVGTYSFPAVVNNGTVYMVMDTASTSATSNFFDALATRWIIGISSSHWTMFAGGVITSSNTVTLGPHVLCGIFNGANSALYVDLSSAPVATGNTGANVFRSPVLGSSAGATGLTGNIAEWIVFPGVHSPAQITAMFAYFSTYYNLPWVS